MFENVPTSPADPMFDLKKRADRDSHPDKVDLGVGIYRDEAGGYHELQCIKDAKRILDSKNLGHNYELTTGNEAFLNHAADIIFGSDFAVRDAQLIASVQTISGTGACHLAAQFLQKCHPSPPRVYIGTPAWSKYEPLFQLVGLDDIHKYTYFDSQRGRIDFDAIMLAVRTAPKHSVFVLQACCHNPSGVDLTRAHWEQLALAMKEQDHMPFFDIAYQGLGTSLDQDSWPIRHFVEMGLEMVVCQSFSKNFGLYGERCGALHVVTRSEEHMTRVTDQLRCLIRWEFSSSPAYGSRLVSIIMEDDILKQKWLAELDDIRSRLQSLRKRLHEGVTRSGIPGNWNGILRSTGLFCLLPLSSLQCERLCQMHIHLPQNGRINLSGLNDRNLEYVVAAIVAVVDETTEDVARSEAIAVAFQDRQKEQDIPAMLEPRL